VAGIKGVCGDKHGLIWAGNQFSLAAIRPDLKPPCRKTLKMITLL
jgi:hypothetical protein